MKTKTIKLLFVFICVLTIHFPLQATSYTLNQPSGNISVLNGNYVDYMDDVWTINTGTAKSVKLTYTIDLEEGCDYITIFSVDESDNATEIITLSGQQSGTISTMIPTGKAKIVFYSDNSVCYDQGYTGFNIDFAIDNSLFVSDNAYVSGDTHINGKTLIDGKLGIGIQPTEKLEVNGNAIIRGNATIRNGLAVGSSSTSGNSIINGKLGIGTTNPTSTLHILSTSPSASGAKIEVAQTQTSLTNNSGGGLAVSYFLNASSSADELVFRGAFIRTDNCLTGGAVAQNQRVLNLVSGSGTGSKTTNLDMILLETGTSTGTTTNAYGLHIVALPGTNKWGIYDQSGSNWYASGKVGIGDVAPEAKLSVVGNAAIGYAGEQTAPENGMIVSGNVGIGTTAPQYKLDVNGTIHAKEIKVDLNGADFVFEKEYNLMPLPDLEKFIKEKKHLPEINPASHMQENGANLGDLNVKLLQKIEELTLYVIDQQKEIETLKKALVNPKK